MLDAIDNLRRDAAQVRAGLDALWPRIKRLEAMLSRDLPQASPARAALDELVLVMSDIHHLVRMFRRAPPSPSIAERQRAPASG